MPGCPASLVRHPGDEQRCREPRTKERGTLDVTSDWRWAAVVAAVSGMVGGIVHDLLLSRQGDSGMLETVSRTGAKKHGERSYIDLGCWASSLTGAVAALGFPYFLTPEVATSADSAGVVTATRLYDPFELVAASLIVGTGGSAFITALHERGLRTKVTAELRQIGKAVEGHETVINDAAPPATVGSDVPFAASAQGGLPKDQGSMELQRALTRGSTLHDRPAAR